MIRYVFLMNFPGYTLESELKNDRSGFSEIILEATLGQVRNDDSQSRVAVAKTQEGILWMATITVIAIDWNGTLC